MDVLVTMAAFGPRGSGRTYRLNQLLACLTEHVRAQHGTVDDPIPPTEHASMTTENATVVLHYPDPDPGDGRGEMEAAGHPSGE